MLSSRLFSCLVLACGLALSAWAQAGGSSATGAASSATASSATATDPSVLAQTVETRSPFATAGESKVANFFDLGLGSQTGYTDNVSGSAGGGSLFENASAGVDLRQKRGGLNWALSYDPSYSWYQRATAFNRFNQAGATELSAQINDHWFLRLSDSASYGRYIVNPGALAGRPGGPLNLGLATPRALQYSQSPTASLIYVANYRNSFQFSGSFLQRRFTGTGAQGLSNLEGATGSASYQYRLSPLSTVGARYSYENASFGAGVGHMVSQTALITYEHVLGPGTKVSLAAGPQRVHETENLNLLFGSPSSNLAPALTVAVRPFRTYFAATGSITHQAGLTALSLTASQSVTDSGGLSAGPAQVTSLTAGAGRRILDVWHADTEVGFERLTAANLTGTRGNLRSVIVSGNLGRQLGRALRLALDVSSTHQLRTGNLPFTGGFHSDSVSLGIFYTWRAGRG